jgi:SAM-dependent methyltransferase
MVNESAFEVFGREADTYDRNYLMDSGRYPDHVYRLKIFRDILAELKPRTVLDAGCGSGIPLVTFLKDGYDAYGFDRSQDMVRATRQRLKSEGFEGTRVFEGDLDTFTSPLPNLFDATLGLGSVYYTPDTSRTLKNLAEHTRVGGSLIFSLRNELFSLCSLNEYSAEYLLNKIFPVKSASAQLGKAVTEYFEARFPKLDTSKLFKNVDERNINSHLHNPLLVEKQLLIPNGLNLRGIYYYHFHALPPIFEHSHQAEFYELSMRREDPSDWRGLVSASCFVVHAEKIF